MTSLPEGSRKTAKVSLYVTSKGQVRYPGLWVSIKENKELVSRQAYEQARDCAIPLLRKLRFTEEAGDPRFYLESITIDKPKKKKKSRSRYKR